MSDQSTCRTCGRPIWFHLSNKTGRKYPTDSETDRRAFHRCTGQQPAPAAPTAPRTAPPQPVQAGAGIRPFLEQRMNELEAQVRDLRLKVDALSKTQPRAHSAAVTPQHPISDEDIPF